MEKLELDYYYGKEAEQFTFYRLPKVLITDSRFKNITNNAKLEQLLGTVNKVKKQINPKLHIEGIMLTMVDGRTNLAKDISELIRETYGRNIKVFDTEIPKATKAAETSAMGFSIFKHDPNGKVAEAYKAVAKEVLKDAEDRRKIRSEQLR